MTASTRQAIMVRSRLKPSGRIGDNMKKILGVLTIIVLLVSVCFYFFPKQPKNIFDEIYQETEKTYRTNNILRNIEGFEIDDVWPSDGDYFKYSVFSILATFCVQIFFKGYQLSKSTEKLHQAVTACTSIAEICQSTDSPEETLSSIYPESMSLDATILIYYDRDFLPVENKTLFIGQR